MGRGDAKNAARFGNIVAVCDVDESHTAAAAKQFGTEGRTPVQLTDFRKVMGTEGRRHHHQRDARSLAHPDQRCCRECEEGHLRGKAVDADR